MKVLAVSDKVDRLLYSPNIRHIVNGVELIISCGDLPMYYLDYLVSIIGKPLYYICGNHDRYNAAENEENKTFGSQSFYSTNFNYNKKTNFGGKNLDLTTYRYKNIIIGGLEGSYLYNYGEHQYNDPQMKRRILKMFPHLFANNIKRKKFIDILVTHAPPYGIHDKDDICHRGFESYLWFIKKFKPKYLLHGHIHIYDNRENRITEYMGVKIINCYNYQILDLDI